jgi:hypothetical protein
MIKFENGLVNISGKGIDILSEYAAITHEIKEMFVKKWWRRGKSKRAT